MIAALMAVVAAHGRWATIEAIEDRDWFYIRGVRMRSSNEARAVADAEGPLTEVLPERETSHDPSPLQAKEIVVGGVFQAGGVAIPPALRPA